MLPLSLLEEVDESLCGTRAAILSVATRAGLPVPEGVALTHSTVRSVAFGHTGPIMTLAWLFDKFHVAVLVRSSEIPSEDLQPGPPLFRPNLRTAEETIAAVREIWHGRSLGQQKQAGAVIQHWIEPEIRGTIIPGGAPAVILAPLRMLDADLPAHQCALLAELETRFMDVFPGAYLLEWAFSDEVLYLLNWTPIAPSAS